MKLSKEKKDKIAEQILSFLYHSFPKQLFTAEIAREIARDEEFVKTLMLELKEKNLVLNIKKNEKGSDFIRRLRWQLSGPAYQAYDQRIKGHSVSTQSTFTTTILPTNKQADKPTDKQTKEQEPWKALHKKKSINQYAEELGVSDADIGF